MKLKTEKGITLVALIITVILMVILVGVSVKFGGKGLEKAKLEDIKTDMISIKTKSKIIVEQFNFKDIDNLIGTPLDINANEEGIQLGEYNIPNDLKTLLEEKDNEGNAKIDISKLYVLTEENFNELGIKTKETTNEKFYIVYYNLKDSNNCEIYYSQGYNGKYSLGELKDL